MTASRLDQRIPGDGIETEFRRLVIVLNAMLDRLERSFHQAARFSADAGHELRTPLTILQGELEQAVQRPPPEPERVYLGLLEEVQRLGAITEKVLLLSQADAGQLRLADGDPATLSRSRLHASRALDLSLPTLATQLAAILTRLP